MRFALLKCGFVFAMLSLSVGGLMYLSHHVQRVQREIASYDNSIEKEQEKIRVLKAEWAYLNNPERLEAIASGAYELQSSDINKIHSDFAFIPDEEDVTAQDNIPSEDDKFIAPQELLAKSDDNSSLVQGGQR